MQDGRRATRRRLVDRVEKTSGRHRTNLQVGPQWVCEVCLRSSSGDLESVYIRSGALRAVLRAVRRHRCCSDCHRLAYRRVKGLEMTESKRSRMYRCDDCILFDELIQSLSVEALGNAAMLHAEFYAHNGWWSENFTFTLTRRLQLSMFIREQEKTAIDKQSTHTSTWRSQS